MKNPKSKLSEPGVCKLCPCSKYLNRIRPDKVDKIGAIVGPMAAILFTIFITSIIISASNLYTEEEKNAPIQLDMTQGEFMNVLFLILILVLIWIGGLCFDPLSSYLRIRKRVSWPIKTSENTLQDGK